MKVWYSTPYAIDKNIGKAYNDFCALVPNGDWICLRDGDTHFLTPDWGIIVNDIAARAEIEGYSLVGAVTNRLNKTSHQLINGMFDSDDILYHYNAAINQKTLYEDQLCISFMPLAGFFMLFPKSIWENNKFEEGPDMGRYIDQYFSRSILKNGGKLGLARGLYVYHSYRPWADNPANDFKHLMP